ncbi:MAG: aldo/keto reductase [Lachnospiraceae bacterium]
MDKVMLGKTGLEITSVFYGGIVSMNDGQDRSDEYVAYAVNKGINYFDVAPSYGDAQEKLGNSLIPFRKQIHLACKTTNRDAEHVKMDLEKSFELLHTDYFDVYQLHSITTVEEVDQVFSKGGAFEPIIKAKEAGALKHLGITCHSEAAALRALEHYDFETILFPTNWGLHMAKDFGSQVIAACKEKEIGLLGMKSLIHRAWTNPEEKAGTMYSKSWCKPISAEQEDFRIAAMRYAYQMGAASLVPPGNFECFSFAVEHYDEIHKPLTDSDLALLAKELPLIGDRFFF